MTTTSAPISETRRLADNVAALGVVQIASFALPLLTLPYLTRVLGPERFGLVAIATATIQYFIILTDFGFHLSATKAVATHRHDQDRVSSTFSSVLIIKSALAAGGAALLASIAAFVPTLRSEWRLFAAAYCAVIGNVLFPVWFFQGIERMRFIADLTLLAKTLFTVAVFVFVHEPSRYVLVPLLQSLGTIAAGVISLFLAVRRFGVRIHLPGWRALHATFLEGRGYFLSRASVTLYTSSNVFFLGVTTSPAAVGLYSSAEKIYGAMQSIYAPLTNALLPYMSRTRDRALFARIFAWASTLNALLCISLLIGADTVVRFVFGAEYAGSAPVLRLLAMAMLFVLPTFLLGYPLLGALGHAKQANQSAIVGSAFHMCGLAILYLVRALNIYTVAALVLLTEILVLALRVYAIRITGAWRATAPGTRPI